MEIELEKLRKKIEKEFAKKRRNVWFYPKRLKVKGWLGSKDVMFVGPNPSCNRFPTPQTDFFYHLLQKNGFENAHLTDLIKIRATNNEADKIIDKYFKNQIKILEKEIDIIKPKLIVIMGNRAKESIKRFNWKKGNLVYIYHYSLRFEWQKERFIRDIKKIKKINRRFKI